MNVAENLFVSIDYILTIESGEEIDRSDENEPLGFIAGSGQIIPGLDSALVGMKEGDSSKVVVEPEDAYGNFDKELVQVIPRDQFPPDEEIEPGMTFQAQGPHGPLMVNILEVTGNESVTVDLNHPLAGKQLIFDVKIVEVREPTQEEVSQLIEEQNCGCGSDAHDSCGCSSGESDVDGCGCASGDKNGGCGCS